VERGLPRADAARDRLGGADDRPEELARVGGRAGLLEQRARVLGDRAWRTSSDAARLTVRPEDEVGRREAEIRRGRRVIGGLRLRGGVRGIGHGHVGEVDHRPAAAVWSVERPVSVGERHTWWTDVDLVRRVGVTYVD